ncbi:MULTISPECIES: hypothetical protein [Gammaproteobacteria]|uniref:hypothetical protein n=1 Tax=Gammaproteobacteria TaxID=1236 RepID=UPI001ADC30E4|nr:MULTISPECIES: hypothetical protein [Gammaproteobacteria]MBO9480038.1 hypothetical protein [Salinisphaera sp. G21_0]MBO9493370.1 hypothetical protein [Thalassotalea sp. G20_0]
MNIKSIFAATLFVSTSAMALDDNQMQFSTDVDPMYGIEITDAQGALRFKGEAASNPTTFKVISNTGETLTVRAELASLNTPSGQPVNDLKDGLYMGIGSNAHKIADGADFINLKSDKVYPATAQFVNIKRTDVKAGTYDAIITLTVQHK